VGGPTRRVGSRSQPDPELRRATTLAGSRRYAVGSLMSPDVLEAALRQWMTAAKFLDPSCLTWERSDEFPRLGTTKRR
jgi:hypothetical protein